MANSEGVGKVWKEISFASPPILILGWCFSGHRGRGDGEWRGRGDGEWRGRGDGEWRGRGEGEGTEILVERGDTDRLFQATEDEETGRVTVVEGMERATVVVDGDEVNSQFWK